MPMYRLSPVAEVGCRRGVGRMPQDDRGGRHRNHEQQTPLHRCHVSSFSTVAVSPGATFPALLSAVRSRHLDAIACRTVPTAHTATMPGRHLTVCDVFLAPMRIWERRA